MTPLYQYMLSIIYILIIGTKSLDCSQYQDFSSCNPVTYCSWTQGTCRCASTVNLDILFTISTSRYIGNSNFNNFIQPWLKELTQFGINTQRVRVGFDVFSAESKLESINTTTWNKMTDYIDSIYYDGGVADLSVALNSTLTTFKSSPYTSQKLNIIIMATDPYKQGTTTAEVCQYASNIKQMGIQVIFVGIGDNWRQERIDCLLGNSTNDIIRINSYSEQDFNNSLPLIYDRTCPINIKVKITEAKPINTQSASRFVEFFNMGLSITSDDTLNLNGLITGSITGNNIDQGKYFVLYDQDEGTLNCTNCGQSAQCTLNSTTNLCNQAVYIPCGSNTNCQFNDQDMTDWNIDISDSSNILDSVIYSTNEWWPIAQSDYSYALEYLGYNNKYGANYVRSCLMSGSPGSPSILNCNPPCSNNADCQYSGANLASCNSDTFECDCSASIGFYPKRGSCYPIPEPSNCVADKIKNGSLNYFRFSFMGAPFDTNEFYSLRYYQTPLRQLVTVTDQSRIRTENDVYYEPDEGYNNISGYVYTELRLPNQNPFISRAWQTNCTIFTQEPTASPTPSPTQAPTRAPTQNPTQAPTWSTPKVYLFGDFCDKDRCSCNGKGFDCCNATDINSNCTDKQSSLTAGFDINVFNSMKIFPEIYPYPTLINWRINYNGTIDTSNNMDLNIDKNTSNNPLGISVYPMNGSIWINGTTSINIPLTLNQSIVCPNNTQECKNKLIGLSAVFIFEAYECISFIGGISGECNVIYPSSLNMLIDRSDTGGGSGGGGGQNNIPTWLWIVLIACAIFLLLLSWLLYRYWYKGRKQSEMYHKITDDIEIQREINDQDFETKLQNKDTEFNPLATGMPTKDREHDPLTAERQIRAQSQQNDMVEPNAVKNVFREEMGQKAGNMNAPLLG